MDQRAVSFDSDIRPVKTVAGRRVLQGGAFIGSRPQRLFLIMVDGQKTFRELAEPARTLGLTAVDLADLTSGGWIALEPPAPLARSPALALLPTAKTPPPVTTRAEPPDRRSLAAAKMYALGLIQLMLPGRDQAMRQISRAVRTEAELRAWVELASREIGRASGPERGRLFLDRVIAQLPGPIGGRADETQIGKGTRYEPGAAPS